MRVRVSIEKNSSANDHVHRIMKLFKKFNSKNNKYRNEINDDVSASASAPATDDDDDDDDRAKKENDMESFNGEAMSDLEILGVSSSKHPCINEEIVQKQTCGMRNKPCEYEVYGIPRKKYETIFCF